MCPQSLPCPESLILPPKSSCPCSCSDPRPPSTPYKPLPSYPELPKSGKKSQPAWTSLALESLSVHLPDLSEPKSLEVVELWSVPCANCDESKCPARLSLPFPEYLGGHNRAGMRPFPLLGHRKQPRLVTPLGACPTPASSLDTNRSVPCSKTVIDPSRTVT